MPELRRRLLDELGEPDSASGLAKKLGLTRQRVNYHLRELERHGLVRLVEERRRHGLTERFLRRTSDVMIVDPTVLAPPGLHERDRFGVAAMIGAASDALCSVALLAAGAAESNRRLATAVVDTSVRFARPSDVRNFTRELADLCARYDTPDGRDAMTYRVATLAYPEAAT